MKRGKLTGSITKGQRSKTLPFGIQSLLSVLKEGVIESNPVFVQVLGTCPALAVTTSAKNAFGMGLAVIFVLMGSNLLISLLRRFIPSQIRIASYIVVISTFVTVIEMLIETYIPGLYNSLGIFLPLIVVNCIVLARAEAYASKNPPLLALLDGFAMGVGFTVALVLLGGIREILGAGTLFEHNLFGEGFKPATLFVKPAGAFIIFGFLMAGVAKLRSYINGKKRNKNDKKEAAAL